MSDVPQGPDWRQDATGKWHPPSAFATPTYPTFPAYPTAPANVYLPSGPRTSAMAVIALVIAILSWLVCPVVGPLISVVLGFSARREIRESNGTVVGDGVALAAIIISGMQLAIGLLLVLGFIAIVLFAPSSTPT